MPNDLSAFNREAWSRKLVDRLDQVNVMLGLVNRDWEGDLRQSKTVKIRTPGNITMGTYVPNVTTINYEALAPTNEDFTVARSDYFAFQVDDVDAAQNDLSAIDVYTPRASVSLSNLIEALLLANYTKVPAANRITNSGSAINLTSEGTDGTSVYHNFVRARTIMTKNHVAPQGRWAVVDPDTVGLLLEDTKHFVRATDMGDSVVMSGMLGMRANSAPGFVGRCAGFDVYESTQCPVVGTDQYLLFGDRMFISYAAQITEIEPLRLQNTFSNAIRGLIVHDSFVAAENAKRGVYLKKTA